MKTRVLMYALAITSGAAVIYGIPGIWSVLALSALVVVLLSIVARTQHRAPRRHRIMELAALVVYVTDVSWKASSNSLFEDVRAAGGVVWAWVPWLFAFAFTASLLRLFLWTWSIEEDERIGVVLGDGHRVYTALDVTMRLAGWFLLLSFPVFLNKKDIPWPLLFGDLGRIDAQGALVLIYALLALWSALLWLRSDDASVRDRARHSLTVDVISCVLAIVLWWIVVNARGKGFSVESIAGMSTAFGVVSGLMAGVLLLDVVKGGYLRLLCEEDKKGPVVSEAIHQSE